MKREELLFTAGDIAGRLLKLRTLNRKVLFNLYTTLHRQQKPEYYFAKTAMTESCLMCSQGFNKEVVKASGFSV